jgi:5-methylcytosine-specific restriction enzyme A
MPSAPKHECSWPGCHVLTTTAKCPDHERKRHEFYDKYNRDKDAKHFYNSSLWDKAREAKKQRSPLCESCKARGIIVSMDIVHHADGHRENLSDDNLVSLCNPCHSKLETMKRGGFAAK